MTRTFIAIELPSEVREALAGQIARLSHVLRTPRWADVADMHLTLAFLGELDDVQLSDATAATQEAAATAAPFILRLAGMGTFGGSRAPRVIWVGVGGDVPALLALQGALAEALVARGFPREERPFSPHLTLARVKAPLAPAELASLPRLLSAPVAPVTWTIEALAVMKSELGRAATRYTALERVPLGEVQASD